MAPGDERLDNVRATAQRNTQTPKGTYLFRIKRRRFVWQSVGWMRGGGGFLADTNARAMVTYQPRRSVTTMGLIYAARDVSVD